MLMSLAGMLPVYLKVTRCFHFIAIASRALACFLYCILVKCLTIITIFFFFWLESQGIMFCNCHQYFSCADNTWNKPAICNVSSSQ